MTNLNKKINMLHLIFFKREVNSSLFFYSLNLNLTKNNNF
ncbi:hypothetical protein BVAVS116_A0063 (plasmid) [Borreliella valaisiana VS116]|uniref:Uncharacterized protein n=1 Tax=Borreliella valaisiana VS116 TaxID=445987 RepID=C0R8A4_BORVA|nr:hypothetical protein BVAVS116_A0063 [Borreliella valaisiana VS116]